MSVPWASYVSVIRPCNTADDIHYGSRKEERIKGGRTWANRRRGGVRMELYLVRHADPKSEAEDPERSLSELGEQQADRIGKFALNAGVRVIRFDTAGRSGQSRPPKSSGDISPRQRASSPSLESRQWTTLFP